MSRPASAAQQAARDKLRGVGTTRDLPPREPRFAAVSEAAFRRAVAELPDLQAAVTADGLILMWPASASKRTCLGYSDARGGWFLRVRE